MSQLRVSDVTLCLSRRGQLGTVSAGCRRLWGEGAMGKPL